MQVRPHLSRATLAFRERLLADQGNHICPATEIKVAVGL
ncbi:hypothetical protein LCGC14_1939820, partial [marine sediment metagenome]